MKKEKNIVNHEHTSNGLTPFSSNMENFAKKLLGQNGLTGIDLLRNWEKIVGEDLASYTFPQKINFKKDTRADGTLYLNVSTGAYALEVQHKTPFIIEKINTYFGYHAVDEIKIIQNNDAFVKNQNINIADIDKKKLVSQEEQNYIDKISEEIVDEDLKERLQSLAKSVILEQKKEK